MNNFSEEFLIEGVGSRNFESPFILVNSEKHAFPAAKIIVGNLVINAFLENSNSWKISFSIVSSEIKMFEQIKEFSIKEDFFRILVVSKPQNIIFKGIDLPKHAPTQSKEIESVFDNVPKIETSLIDALPEDTQILLEEEIKEKEEDSLETNFALDEIINQNKVNLEWLSSRYKIPASIGDSVIVSEGEGKIVGATAEKVIVETKTAGFIQADLKKEINFID